jgi:hypothetical protein
MTITYFAFGQRPETRVLKLGNIRLKNNFYYKLRKIPVKVKKISRMIIGKKKLSDP